MAYISEITFVASVSALRGVRDMINVDMNKRSFGKCIYPVKHFTDDEDEAIAGLAFIQNDALVPTGYTKIGQDLNEGAPGSYNYLCTTKLGNNKMTDVDFIASYTKPSDTIVNGYFRYPADLNTGTWKYGAYVYLLYKTNTGVQF